MKTDIALTTLTVAAVVGVLAFAGPALDNWLTQSQAADLAAAQQRQQLDEERALQKMRRMLAQACGNGYPVISASNTVQCATRSPR